MNTAPLCKHSESQAFLYKDNTALAPCEYWAGVCTRTDAAEGIFICPVQSGRHAERRVALPQQPVLRRQDCARALVTVHSCLELSR